MEDSTFYNLYGKEHYEEGRVEERRLMLKNILNKGLSMEEVSKLTDVPLMEIKSLGF